MQNRCFHCMKPTTSTGFCPYCGSNLRAQPAAPYHLKPGTVLSQRYLIGEVIGEGGFGITYIGLDQRINKRVAVKEYFLSGTANRTAEISGDIFVTQDKEMFYRRGVDRFMAEAQNIAAFSAVKGIVEVLDCFRENNTAYIVMEYLEGETLKDFINRRGTFAPDTIIALMMPVMQALNLIHREGVIHRDITPDNIMLTKNGELKLIDFGSARYYINEARDMSVVLKHGYAPEEQYSRNGSQGPYTDVYALCATIYTCITGRVPENSLDRMKADRLVPPSRLGIAISPVHERALLHGLAPNAAYRCPDMTTLMREFEGSCVPPDISQTVSAGDSRYFAEANRSGAGWAAYENRNPQPNNKPVIIAVIITTAAVLAAMGVLTYLLLRGNGSHPTPATTAAAEPASTNLPASDVLSTFTNPPSTTTQPPTTQPPTTTQTPTTTQPPTSTLPPQPTSRYLSHDQVQEIIEYQIVPKWEEADSRINEARSGSSYDYVICSDNRLWVGTKDSFHDDSKNKIWYFFDENHRLYFVYEHTSQNEYRYYVYNDEVIKMTVGPTGDQTQYFHGDSMTETDSIRTMIANAYAALNSLY